MSIKITGLDKLKRQLKALEQGAKKVEGTHHVPMEELLHPAFLTKHSQFQSFAEMEAEMQKEGFTTATQEDWDAIPDEEIDRFIGQHTEFSSWQEMLNKAGADWVKREMGL